MDINLDINPDGTFTTGNTFNSTPRESPSSVIETPGAGKKRKVKLTKKSYRKKRQTKKIKNKKKFIRKRRR